MIGSFSAGTGVWRQPFTQLAAIPPLPVPQASVPPMGNFAGFPPTWQSLGPIKQAIASPFGYPMTQYTLPNGHRLMIEQRPTDIVSLKTYVNTGSILENPVHPSPLYGQTGLPSGIAHLDEHCHFLTTEHYPVKNSLANAMESYGIILNAGTSDEFIYHVATFNREDLAPVLKLHAESVLKPVYTVDILQEKKAVINEASKNYRQPEYKLMNKLCELMHDRPVIQTVGTTQDVMATTPEQMRRFYNLAYNPTNMVTVISGNVNPDEVLNLLGPAFGSNPPRNAGVGNIAIQTALRPGEVRYGTVVDPQLTNSKVVIGFPAPPSNQYRERIAMEFLRELISSDPLSLLQDQVVRREQAATSAGSFYFNLKQSGLLGITLDMPPGQEQNALASTFKALERLSRGDISGQSIASTRERLLRSFEERRNSVEGGVTLIGEEAVRNTLPYMQNYRQLVDSVTADDIVAAARKYLDPSRYAVVFGVAQAPGTAPSVPVMGGPR